jgi:uncharacterized protein YndB with AHSA1/START domain
MAKDTIKVTSLLPATPHDVYEAWLDSALHARMTGGSASISPTIGGRHTAWDGYIEGTNVELEPGRRIVQTWRTSDFPADAEDSRIEIRLESEDGSTRVTIEHLDIPEGQGKNYESGWREHYFRPMSEYFADLAAADAEPVTEAMPFAAAAAIYAASPASDEAPTLKAPRVIAAAARKMVVAKKAPAKPAAKKKPASKKDPAPKKKPAAAKAKAKKAVAKKPAPKKGVAKKAAAKKGVAKKAAPKKAAPKKVSKKKTSAPAKAKKAAKSKARSPKARR